MTTQMDLTPPGDEGAGRPAEAAPAGAARRRSSRRTTGGEDEPRPEARPPLAAGEAPASPEPATERGDPAAFGDLEQLRKKGLRVVPVVTGAVVDAGGNFLFYLDGHDDARAAVQAQVNHLLDCGPSREEHLAPARTRARYVLEKLSNPR